ncbi:MAG: hypothetical protein AB7F35_27690 [Acetobacteraceae bacterium]
MPINTDLVTPDVIAADLSNILVGFMRWLDAGQPAGDPNVSITAAQDEEYAKDRAAFVPLNDADPGELTRMAHVMGHIIGGSNDVGQQLAELLNKEMLVGDGRGFISVTWNFDFFKELYFGPASELRGSLDHYLIYVAEGMTPAAASERTFSESIYQFGQPAAVPPAV